jgi:hypothetical protein
MASFTQRTFITDPTQNPQGWQLLNYTALSAAASSIDTGVFTGKKSLQVIIYILGKSGAGGIPNLTFNGDSGANYSYRYSNGGAADTTGTSQSNIPIGNSSTEAVYAELNITNLVTTVHRAFFKCTEGGAKAAAPDRREGAARYEGGASEYITRITVTASANNLNTGTYIYVYGAD